MPRSLKILILDYDMTLVNNLIDFYEAYNESLKNHCSRVISFEEFYRALLRDELDAESSRCGGDFFWRFFRRVYRTRTGYLVRGAREILVYSRAIGLRNIIATGRDCLEREIYDEIKRFDLEDLVDEVYTIETLRRRGLREEFLFDKRDMIRAILRDHGASPEEAVFIGDYTTDYLSSVGVGVVFIGVANDEYAREILERRGVKCVAKDLYEALEKIFLAKKDFC